MRTFVRVLIIIAAVIGLAVAGILLFTDRVVTVQRTAEINAPAEVVFGQVNDFRNWEQWSPWAKMDPDMKIEYFGETGPGHSYTWTSENPQVGNGKLAIEESKPFESIKTKLSFDGQGDGQGAWAFKEEGGKTAVSWSMTMDMGSNPIGRVFGAMLDGQVGPMFEQGLGDLKTVAEYEAEALRKAAEEAAEAAEAEAAAAQP
ncbi:MAG: SRPBCC family protein [Bacteroidota bacterium]